MAFQFTNYAQLAPQGNPGMRDLISNLAQGYKSGRMPYEMQQQEKEQELKNAMQSLLNEEQPQKFGSDMLTAQLAQAMQGMKNKEEPQRFGSEMSGQQLTQAMQRMRNQEEPQTFASDMAMHRATLDKLAMETDPARKAAYVQGLIAHLGGSQVDKDNQVAQIDQDNRSAPSQDLMKSYLRKELGMPEQTPAEKATQQLDLYKEKLDLKNQGTADLNSMGQPTRAFLTANQKTIQAMKNALPAIQELIDLNTKGDVPGQDWRKYLNPNKQASYGAAEAKSVDTIQKALALSGTNLTLKKVEQMAARQPFETAENYGQRLQSLYSDIEGRQKRLEEIPGSNISNTGKGSEKVRRKFNPITGDID